MIEIFPNLLDGGPCDSRTTDRRMTIAQWLNGYCKDGYSPGDDMPVIVKVEGEVIEEAEWPSFVFRPADHVEVRVVPRGTDPFSITAALFAGAKAVFGMLMPSLPGTPNVPGQGSDITTGSVRGNKVKLGQPIRESFGTQKIYPDYLIPSHRYFSDPRTQQVRFCMNIGRGNFQINADTVCIGDTSILALGSEAEYHIYNPGDLISGDPSTFWWHQVPEVGSSTTGSAGLELTAATSITPNAIAASLTFSGYTISIPSGSGTFPADWAVGLIIRVIAPYSYTVTDGGGAARDIITGPLSMLAPVAGQSVEIAGTNAGRYEVNSYDGTNLRLDFAGGAPANSLAVGTALATIGPVGLRYRILSITPSSITVQRLTSGGANDASFPGFNAMSTTQGQISVDSSSLQGGWRGPFPACPPGEKTNQIEWDIFCPEGLCGVGREGGVYTLQVGYELQYRDMELGGGWVSIPRSISGTSLDQQGFTETQALPYLMRPEVRIRKTFPLAENIEYRDTAQWYGLKSVLISPDRYDGCTIITGRIQMSDRIAAQTESQINVIATRVLPIRRAGTWLPAQATRELAPAAIYVAKSLGLTDADIDLAELDRLSDGVWSDRLDQFNASITDETTAKDVLNNIFACGFSEMTIDDGKIRPVRDEPRTVFEQMYSAQNMTDELSLDSTLKSENDYDGVQVTYIDQVTWTEETVDCRLPFDPIPGRKIEKIEAPGIIDRTKAYQFGMRRRRVHEYRRDSFSWSTPGDANNSRYLSYCAVSADVPGYSQSAILKEWQVLPGGAVRLTSSEPLDWSTPGAYAVALRKTDGTLSGPYTPIRLDDFNFTVPGIDFVPNVTWDQALDPPHIMFGPNQTWTYPVLITSVAPKNGYDAAAEAVNYDPRVYLSDNAVP